MLKNKIDVAAPLINALEQYEEWCELAKQRELEISGIKNIVYREIEGYRHSARMARMDIHEMFHVKQLSTSRAKSVLEKVSTVVNNVPNHEHKRNLAHKLGELKSKLEEIDPALKNIPRAFVPINPNHLKGVSPNTDIAAIMISMLNLEEYIQSVNGSIGKNSGAYRFFAETKKPLVYKRLEVSVRAPDVIVITDHKHPPSSKTFDTTEASVSYIKTQLLSC